MNEKILNDLEKSKFGDNKYYKEIIKEFISEYQFPRVTINNDLIEIESGDKVGSRDISITLNDSSNLVVKVNRNFDMMRFQDIIVYDNKGIMIERTNTQTELKKDINEKFKDNQNVLLDEFNELGQHPSIYTGEIFKSINLRKIKRAENYNINGLYTHKEIFYDEHGLMNGKIMEGTFNVLNSDSISSLEFPNESSVFITKEEILDDNNIYGYPNSRSL